MTTEKLNHYDVTLEMYGHTESDIEEQLESLDAYETESIVLIKGNEIRNAEEKIKELIRKYGIKEINIDVDDENAESVEFVY